MSDHNLNREICELIGAFIGDGHFGRYGKKKNTYLVGFVGHKTLDAEYLTKLAGTITKYFPESNPRVYCRNDENTIRVLVYSKEMYEFLENLGFNQKNKSKTAIIPESILADKNLLRATIRGIFDTDGSVFFDKRKIFKVPYPRIDLHLNNEPLVRQVHESLLSVGVPSKITTKSTKVQINGKQGISQFMEEIGFSNQKHLAKIIKAPAEI